MLNCIFILFYLHGTNSVNFLWVLSNILQCDILPRQHQYSTQLRLLRKTPDNGVSWMTRRSFSRPYTQLTSTDDAVSADR